MNYEEIKAAWNAQADEYNQWETLSEIEKIEWAVLNAAEMAAAPQSPESAPVQMPEPDAWRYTTVRDRFRYRGRRVGFAAEYPMLKPEPLYTEQQVRAIVRATMQCIT